MRRKVDLTPVRGQISMATQHSGRKQQRRSTADSAQAFLDERNARLRDYRKGLLTRLERIDAALAQWDEWDALPPLMRHLQSSVRPPSVSRESLLELRRLVAEELGR
jgi:hypothetical protein